MTERLCMVQSKNLATPRLRFFRRHKIYERSFDFQRAFVCMSLNVQIQHDERSCESCIHFARFLILHSSCPILHSSFLILHSSFFIPHFLPHFKFFIIFLPNSNIISKIIIKFAAEVVPIQFFSFFWQPRALPLYYIMCRLRIISNILTKLKSTWKEKDYFSLR